MPVQDLIPAFITNLQTKVRQTPALKDIVLMLETADLADGKPGVNITIWFSKCEHDLSSDTGLSRDLRKVRKLIIEKTTAWIQEKTRPASAKYLINVSIAKLVVCADILRQVQQDTLIAVQLIADAKKILLSEEELNTYKYGSIEEQRLALQSAIQNYLFLEPDFSRLFGRFTIPERALTTHIFRQIESQIVKTCVKLLLEGPLSQNTPIRKKIMFLLPGFTMAPLSEGPSAAYTLDMASLIKHADHLSATEDNCMRIDLLISALKHYLDSLKIGLDTLNKEIILKINFLNVRKKFIADFFAKVSEYSKKNILMALPEAFIILQKLEVYKNEVIFPFLDKLQDNIKLTQELIELFERKRAVLEIPLTCDSLEPKSRNKILAIEEATRNRLLFSFSHQAQKLKAVSSKSGELASDLSSPVPYEKTPKATRVEPTFPKELRSSRLSDVAAELAQEVNAVEPTHLFKMGPIELTVSHQGFCEHEAVYRIGSTRHLYITTLGFSEYQEEFATVIRRHAENGFLTGHGLGRPGIKQHYLEWCAVKTKAANLEGDRLICVCIKLNEEYLYVPYEKMSHKDYEKLIHSHPREYLQAALAKMQPSLIDLPVASPQTSKVI